MTEREGPWSNLRSQCRLAREFRRLEAISAFEVSILVLMEQASCCTSVKTGSNFNWIPRLDFIGSVPTGEMERKGKETESGKFPSSFLLWIRSLCRRIENSDVVRDEGKSIAKFSMKESAWTWITARLDSFREKWFISMRANFLFLFLFFRCWWKVWQTNSWKIDESTVEEKQFFRGTVSVNWKLDILLNFSCYVSAKREQSFEIVYFALTFRRKCSCRD